MKRLIALSLALICGHVFSAAVKASESAVASSSSRSERVTERYPYLDLLSNAKDLLPTHNLLAYEFNDLLEQAEIEHQKIVAPSLTRLIGALQRAETLSSTEDLEEILNDSIGNSADEMDLLKSIFEAVLYVNTPKRAFNILTAHALKRRLKSRGTEIHRALFSPLNRSREMTKIEETLRWLIRCEQKAIKIAAFRLNNERILNELKAAMNRGVSVEIIIDEGDPKDPKYQEGLRKVGLPYKTWKHFYSPKSSMHHKFMLFESNIDGDSILASGSYNFTNQANSNYENIIILNDKRLYSEFLNQFDSIDSYAQQAQFSPVHVSDEITSPDSPESADDLKIEHKMLSGLPHVEKLLQLIKLHKERSVIESQQESRLWDRASIKRQRSS